MHQNPLETIKKLERLAAWHRINAEYAGADWVWEARLRTAEDLERHAAKIRIQRPDDRDRRRATSGKYTSGGPAVTPRVKRRQPCRERA